MEDQSTVVRENQDDLVAKPKNRKLSKRKKRLVVILLWLGLLSPTYGLILMIWVSSSNIPSFEQLENSKSLLASTIYTSDNVEMGRYFRKNRTTTKFHELSPYLINALIATEDERFREHSGVDFRATARVIKGMLSGDKNKGGGSTISQQLAKQLFPRPSGIEEGSKI